MRKFFPSPAHRGGTHSRCIICSNPIPLFVNTWSFENRHALLINLVLEMVVFVEVDRNSCDHLCKYFFENKK